MKAQNVIIGIRKNEVENTRAIFTIKKKPSLLSEDKKK